MIFGRLIRLCTPNWDGPLTTLEALAIGNEHRAPLGPQPSVPVRVWGLDALDRPRVVNVQPIKPGSPEYFLNGADPSCVVCGGHGQINRFVGDSRKTVPCECFDAARCEW